MYSSNYQSWFSWIFDQCDIKPGMKILEIGCGNGSLWIENYDKIPSDVSITLSDISGGMLRDARRAISTINDTENKNGVFLFRVIDAQHLPYEDESFDLIIANHVLFYCENLNYVCEEVKRILKKDGTFLCSTYGQNHMKEISQLVSDFDDRIVLSGEKLYERFGKENGNSLLAQYFSQITWQDYDDHLNVTEPEPLISYVLSCHGNQNQYIIDHYKDFRAFVKKKTENGFYITKDAGTFIIKK